MKQISILIFLFSTLLSCNNTNEDNQIIGKKFFVYDAIDYYKTDFDESKIGELFDNISKSEIDSFKMEIILGNIPNSITDLTFIQKLEEVGYKKTTVDTSKFEGIDKIFIEKTTVENIYAACIHVYRDILIFKKEGQVVGTAKICFDCLANQITGTTANSKNFGQNGDYVKLARILRQ
ncbi:MAG: hypothetical protein IPN13_09825 [Bacteroidetes bacterium]|nr:hypothetical protein [Bacteroidota bacterium]